MLAAIDSLPEELGLPSYLWSTLDDYQFSWDNNASLSLSSTPPCHFLCCNLLLLYSTCPFIVYTHSVQNTYIIILEHQLYQFLNSLPLSFMSPFLWLHSFPLFSPYLPPSPSPFPSSYSCSPFSSLHPISFPSLHPISFPSLSSSHFPPPPPSFSWPGQSTVAITKCTWQDKKMGGTEQHSFCWDVWM